MKSLITDKTHRCYACGSKRCVEWHRIYHQWREGAPETEMSGGRMLIVPLCAFHHRGSAGAVHGERGGRLDMELKKVGQKAYEKRVGTRERFVSEFGKSYL